MSWRQGQQQYYQQTHHVSDPDHFTYDDFRLVMIAPLIIAVWILVKLIMRRKAKERAALQSSAPDYSAPPTGPKYRISYRDFHGDLSDREISIYQAIAEHGISFQAYCHSRRDTRTFRSDRIEKMICLDTGETIQNPIVFAAEMYSRQNS